MVTRIGGLASGMDIDSMVAKLMSAERMPLNKLYQKKQVAEWTRDSYRSVNSKMKTFSDYTFDNILLAKNFLKKTSSTSGANSSKVSVNATAGAAGNLEIQAIKQLATNAKVAPTQVADTYRRVATTDDTLETALGIGADGSFKLNVTNSSGVTSEKTISFAKGDKVSDLITELSKAGLSNSRFDASTGKITIAGANGATFTVSDVDSANTLKSTFGFNLTPSSTSTALSGTVTNSNTLDTLGIPAGANTFKVKVGDTEKSIAYDSTDTISSFLTKLNATGNGIKASFDEETKKFSIASSTAGETLTISDGATVNALGKLGISTSTSTSSSHLVDSTQTATTSGSTLLGQLGATGLTDGSITLNVLQSDGSTKETKISYNAGDTIDSFINRLNTSGAGVTALFSNGKLTLGANNSGTVKDGSTSSIQVIDDSATTNNASKLLSALGLNSGATAGTTKDSKATFDLVATKETATAATDAYNAALADDQAATDAYTAWQADPGNTTLEDDYNTKQAKADETDANALGQIATKATASAANSGQDAIYAVNGLVMTSNSNTVNVSGYEITLNGTFNDGNIDASNQLVGTPTGTVSTSSSIDINNMVDKIKEFVTKYNEFIGGLNDLIKEPKYRSYTPLTDEQREEMSEKEQELWDEKAKSGLLRSDSMLRDGLSTMRTALGGRVDGLGSGIIDTLAEIGITTSSNYSDGGKLVINESKLRQAIANDPDRVVNTLTQSGEASGGTDTRGVVYRLRDAMNEFTKKIDTKAGRTTMTDSQYAIGKNIVDMDKRIDAWKLKLENIETRYWKQFTAMEKAINKANEQSSYFMQFSGQ